MCDLRSAVQFAILDVQLEFFLQFCNMKSENKFAKICKMFSIALLQYLSLITPCYYKLITQHIF